MQKLWFFLLPCPCATGCIATPMRMLLKTHGNPDAQACSAECRATLTELFSLVAQRRELEKKPPLPRTPRFEAFLQQKA